MIEIMTIGFGLAVLAIAILDLSLNPEPILVLRRGAREQGGGIPRILLGGLVMIAARVAIGVILFWLVQRTDPLFEIAALPFSLADIVYLAAGALLLIRALSEILQLSYRRFADRGPDGETPQLSPGSVATAAALASVEPAVLALGLASSWQAIVAGLVLGAILLLALAGPMARAINRYPHLRLLGLAALAVIGGALVLSALGGAYPRLGVQIVVIVLALIALGAMLVARQSQSVPGIQVIPAALFREPRSRDDRSAPIEPSFDDEDEPETILLAPNAGRRPPAPDTGTATIIVPPPPPPPSRPDPAPTAAIDEAQPAVPETMENETFEPPATPTRDWEQDEEADQTPFQDSDEDSDEEPDQEPDEEPHQDPEDFEPLRPELAADEAEAQSQAETEAEEAGDLTDDDRPETDSGDLEEGEEDTGDAMVLEPDDGAVPQPNQQRTRTPRRPVRRRRTVRKDKRRP